MMASRGGRRLAKRMAKGMGMTNVNEPDAAADLDGGDILYPAAVPFLLVHAACLAAIWTGVTEFDCRSVA